MTTQISDKITIEVAQNIVIPAFLPLHGVRIGNFEISANNVASRNVSVHNWQQSAENAGMRILRLSIDGYFQATSGELILQQAAISGASVMVKILSANVQLLVTQMQINRFIRTQIQGQIESFKCELQSSNLVAFNSG